jgi:hypothetical protein
MPGFGVVVTNLGRVPPDSAICGGSKGQCAARATTPSEARSGIDSARGLGHSAVLGLPREGCLTGATMRRCGLVGRLARVGVGWLGVGWLGVGE